jgi:uncharacterized membrane protein (DUF485 family)
MLLWFVAYQPGGSAMETTGLPCADRYVIAHRNPEFAAVSDRWRRFIRRWSIGLLAWWLPVIVLGAFAPGFYSVKVLGDVNIGLLAVLGTFVLTVLITVAYLRFADRAVDPMARQLRTDLKGSI